MCALACLVSSARAPTVMTPASNTLAILDLFTIVCISERASDCGRKKKGRELNAPQFRHREAPTEEARQAAPGWARARSVLCSEIRGFELDRSRWLRKIGLCWLCCYMVLPFLTDGFLLPLANASKLGFIRRQPIGLVPLAHFASTVNITCQPRPQGVQSPLLSLMSAGPYSPAQ